MRKLWQRFIQGVFGEPDSLQGDWLGWEECDIDCEGCTYCDTFEV